MMCGLCRTGIAAALSCALGAFLVPVHGSAEPVLVYSQDWSGGSGGWGPIGGFRPAARFHVGHPLAPFAYWFGGGCGLGMRMGNIPQMRMKLSTLVYMRGSNRNGLSVNVRSEGGALIYKYSMGGGNRVDANCQPPTDTIRPTRLTYALRVPYELYSIWLPGTGKFAIGLKNMLTGEDNVNGLFSCRSLAAPGAITFDQEGGQGPGALGSVKIWVGE